MAAQDAKQTNQTQNPKQTNQTQNRKQTNHRWLAFSRFVKTIFKGKSPWAIWTLICIVIVSIFWWGMVGQWKLERVVLIVCLSLAAFMVGALIGFLFSSHGEEETSPIGKIRDWLLGIITALTVVKVAALKGALAIFAAGPGPVEFAFPFANAIFYSGVGFFFMYFQRELGLNVLLAKSRKERGKLEGTTEAARAVQNLQVSLKPSLLSGGQDIDDIEEISPEEKSRLTEDLHKPEVDTFLKQAEEAATCGCVDWDIVDKTAYIYYYRTYFLDSKKEEEKQTAVKKALEWIIRALNMNPLHVDFTMKYADMRGALKEYDAAVAILEKLALRPEAPAVVKQWLGYYLRFSPDPKKLEESLRLSEEYHKVFPDETDSFFSVAYVYASKYCKELRSSGKIEDLNSETRKQAIAFLRQALQDQPKMASNVQTWIEKGKELECMSHDKEFRVLVDLPKEP